MGKARISCSRRMSCACSTREKSARSRVECPRVKIVATKIYLTMGATGTTAARLEQPLLPLQIAERPNVCQGEGEAILVFVTHRSEREAAVFKADAAAVLVIGGLR